MAITTLKLWMAPESNRLLSGPSSFAPAQNPVFYEGNTARIELHILAGAGVGKVPYEVPFPAGSSIKLAVGQVNAFPTSGTWQLMVDTIETADMPFNASPAQVAAALNALAVVQAAGGVTCAANGDGYTITWNTYGTKPEIGIGSDTLVPSSYESISLVQQGTADNRKVIYVELRQAPVALGVDWSPLPAPVMTVSEVTAWNGTTQTWRYNIEPSPKAGSYNLTVVGSTTKSYTISYSSTADNITTQLATDFTSAKAYKTGEAQFDIVFHQQVTLTADGNGLIGYLGYVGNVNFSTAEIHQFIGGLSSRQTTLEVAIESGNIPQTIIQVPCLVSSDVISNGVLAPLPLGTAMSEQVANARFVRRDLDQNPDAATLDVIWPNLGVDTLGSDVAGALNAADSPSAANPFATISDIPNVTQAEWGNIIGTLANQTDLAGELNFLNTTKYDVSNPAGYITQAYLIDYARLDGANFTGRVTLEGGDRPPNLNISACNTGQHTLTPGDIWFESGHLNYIIGINPEAIASTSWVEQYIGGVGFATESWVQSQGYLTTPFNGGEIYNPLVVKGSDLNNFGLTVNQDSISIVGESGFYGASSAGFGLGGFSSSLAQFPNFPSVSLTAGYGLNVTENGSQTVVNNGTLTLNGVEPYARKDGTTFTGKVVFGTSNAYQIVDVWGGFDVFPINSPDNMVLRMYPNGISFTSNLPNQGACSLNAQGLNITNTAGTTTSIGVGATFQGKVNLATISASIPSVNLGGQCDSAPASATNGDLWISNAASPKLTYRAGGVNYNLAVLNQFNTFTGQMVINTTSSTTAALRVTQLGAGNAIEVEDSTTPDATRFVVDQFGKVGVGTAPDATAAIKVDANGISFNGLVFNPTGTTSHTGGPDTLDLLVTINGVNYRLGLRPA